MRLHKDLREFIGLLNSLPDQIIQLGQPPFRIDILTSVSGVEFEQIWDTRSASHLEGISINVIDREALILNKKASGRLRDIADLAALDGGT